MNEVQYIIQNRPLSYEDKVSIKTLGRRTPHLNIKQTSSEKTSDSHKNRYFNKDTTYRKYSWICGCEEVNKLFCFVCLLCSASDSKYSPWALQGIDNLKNLYASATKHEMTASHLSHLLDYSVLGSTDIRQQLDSAYFINIREHNATVDKNRLILRRLIMCIKFCGAFELAVCGHDESGESENSNIFPGLINFAAELDCALSDHLKGTMIFKGTSETIQNELLDAILQVCRNEIIEQVSKSNFVALEVNETTDSFNRQQLVIVFRYVYEGEIFERFWGFVQPSGNTAEDIAYGILEELEFLGIPTNKLIAQSYNGASVMIRENGGVQSIIRQKYPGAFFIHCYAHEFNLLLEKAASCNKKLKMFFVEIQSFATFFSQNSKRTAVLDEVVEKRLPRGAPTMWDFKTRTICTLYEKQEFIHECLEQILNCENDSKTIIEANGLLRILDSADFRYFLEGFYYIVPLVDTLFNQIRSQETDSVHIQECINDFEYQILDIEEKKFDCLCEEIINDPEPSASKRRRLDKVSENNRIVLEEYCAVLLDQIKVGFDFTGHLSAASLFLPYGMEAYKEDFPNDSLNKTIEAYPFLNKERLKTELIVIYRRSEDMRCDGILPFLKFIMKNNLQQGFCETRKLLDILCTTPMTTCESERCFSTLSRIKRFLQVAMGTMTQDKLNALAFLSIEKKLAQSIVDFDNRIISIFADRENRRFDFNYK